jgi:hypothetical protein
VARSVEAGQLETPYFLHRTLPKAGRMRNLSKHLAIVSFADISVLFATKVGRT